MKDYPNIEDPDIDERFWELQQEAIKVGMSVIECLVIVGNVVQTVVRGEDNV